MTIPVHLAAAAARTPLLSLLPRALRPLREGAPRLPEEEPQLGRAAASVGLRESRRGQPREAASEGLPRPRRLAKCAQLLLEAGAASNLRG